HWWERPPQVGRVPEHRTDTGVYLVAEVFGCRSMIFIKDEDGLYTADPKKDPKAEFIPKISCEELIERDLDDLIVERRVIELMLRARHARSISSSRSEEHTSELQSRGHLVCRLLLEKKK